MSTTCVKRIELNMGGCLPIASEITDFQVDCEAGTIMIEQTSERGEVTQFVANLCPDGDTDVSDVTFDHATGELSITESGNTISTTLDLCLWFQNQPYNGEYIGGL